MDTGDYLCEELMEEVIRGDIPIYRGLINLRELFATGLISPNQRSECRRQLNDLVEHRASKNDD